MPHVNDGGVRRCEEGRDVVDVEHFVHHVLGRQLVVGGDVAHPHPIRVWQSRHEERGAAAGQGDGTEAIREVRPKKIMEVAFLPDNELHQRRAMRLDENVMLLPTYLNNNSWSVSARRNCSPPATKIIDFASTVCIRPRTRDRFSA